VATTEGHPLTEHETVDAFADGLNHPTALNTHHKG